MIDQIQIILQHIGIFSTRYVQEPKEAHMINGRMAKEISQHSLEVRSRFAIELAEMLEFFDERKIAGKEKIGQDMKVCKYDQIPYAGKIIFGEFSNKHLGGGWYQDADNQNSKWG